MRAECHLIVKSLSSSGKHSDSVTARLGSGARGTYFCAYHSDHHQITDHQVGAVVGMHLMTRKNKSGQQTLAKRRRVLSIGRQFVNRSGSIHRRLVVFHSREPCCMLVRFNLEVPTILIFTVSHLFVPSLAPSVFPWSVLIGESLLARSSLFS
jgi:hypothetical protein